MQTVLLWLKQAVRMPVIESTGPDELAMMMRDCVDMLLASVRAREPLADTLSRFLLPRYYRRNRLARLLRDIRTLSGSMLGPSFYVARLCFDYVVYIRDTDTK